ncbi:hypothetical protein FRX31_014576 [Thalictrum thalictroides]|uniref:Uncharacterized protein n=1 Tax=Thalictrum thalictroides TaxID=46969 RepID=A0A7J6WIC0_THATH|nr:hypothetical protein FRX31_014576 [Thalictrum thalictroides]
MLQMVLLVEIWLRKIDNGIFSWIKTFSIHRELIAPITWWKTCAVKIQKIWLENIYNNVLFCPVLLSRGMLYTLSFMYLFCTKMLPICAGICYIVSSFLLMTQLLM